MPQIVNMLDAKTSLSKLVHDLETGGADEFIIARNGRPVARLVALRAADVDRSRRIGGAEGRFDVPDKIDPTNDVIELLFEGN